MYLSEADSALLKTWIIKAIEQVSDADADVLADYALALITADEPEPVVRVTCVESLKDFLPNNAETFTDDLLNVIRSKAYDPTHVAAKPNILGAQSNGITLSGNPFSPRPSRKREFNHEDDALHQHGSARGQGTLGDRPSKSSRKSRGAASRGGKAHSSRVAPFAASTLSPNTTMQGMPAFDLNNPMAAMQAMQQMMNMMAAFQGGALPCGEGPPSTSSKVPRCKDYDTQGFCVAGVSCPYEHGNAIVMNEDSEYDPKTSSLLDVAPDRVGNLPTSRGRGGDSLPGRGRGTVRNPRGGGNRSEFSLVGWNHDLSNTRIVVEQIPEESLSQQSVHGFFSAFGTIEDITIRPERRLAIVKFDDHHGAQAAYRSPKVIFDNRFVRVFWHKPDDANPSNGVHEPFARQGMAEDGETRDESGAGAADFAVRQQEAQRKFEETQKRRKDALQQQEKVNKKLKAIEFETKCMAEALAKKTGKSVSQDSGAFASAADDKESEQTVALKAQLAKLETEAKSLGIDPQVTIPADHNDTSDRGRGGFRGRVRGMRGYSTGFRGRWAGSALRGGAVMRLDNRPKTVSVTFADGTYEAHEEALRQFLLFNNFDTAKMTKHPERDDTALVTYVHRYEGEKFMNLAGDAIPHAGKLVLGWYKSA